MWTSRVKTPLIWKCLQKKNKKDYSKYEERRKKIKINKTTDLKVYLLSENLEKETFYLQFELPS